MKTVECEECGGDGYIEYPVSGFDGPHLVIDHYDRQHCTYCHGTGSVEARAVADVPKIVCPDCEGKGYFEFAPEEDEWDEDGEIITSNYREARCSTCNGSGEVVYQPSTEGGEEEAAAMRVAVAVSGGVGVVIASEAG